MRKIIFILSIFVLIANSCKHTTEKRTEIKNSEELTENIYTFSEQKYLIKDNGVDIFLIGQNIPVQADGYSISKSIEIRTEEGTDFEIIVYTVSEDGQAILNIEKFPHEVETDSERIDNILILSEKFKTAENIGINSTIEDFIAVYPDFTIWYTYLSDSYVIEAGEPFSNVIFILDGNDFLEEGGPEFESEVTILKPSEFKKNSKIKEIRIRKYGE